MEQYRGAINPTHLVQYCGFLAEAVYPMNFVWVVCFRISLPDNRAW